MNNMGNDFIEYLNSMNNANSCNKNALAESQVLDDYYDDIKITRKLGDILYEKLFNSNPIGVILTGHAGDGKTSILIQILEKIGYFSKGKKPLKESELYNEKLFYVKDMSELNEENQKSMLKKFLKYPNKNISSLLVSNTGPLINTFGNILDKDSSEQLEINLLNRLDRNDLESIEIEIDGEICTFIAVNMANIDNTYIVKDIMTNLLKETLWEKCMNCEVKEKCPIAFNYNICSKNMDRIVNILEQIYTWFKENESRLTIRQMISHISFALTGNLTCKEINNYIIYKKDVLFDYAFPNLLFGYKGIQQISESLNIKAIKELNKISIDQNALPMDYQLFVREEFEMFDEEVKFILEEKLKQNQNDLGVNSNDATRLRRAFRRFYILISKIDDDEFDKLKESIFSEAFNIYYKLSNDEIITHKEKSKLKDIVFEGLYKTFIGVYPKDENTLYLTVKKELDEIQNVQLILGEVPKKDISIKNVLKECSLRENDSKYEIILNFSRCNYDVRLTFQMLQYFMKIGEGEIFTTLNPSFTFGLNSLKAKLLRSYRYDEDAEINLLVINKNKPDNISFIIENGKMEVL